MTDDPYRPRCVLCGEPVSEEWIEVVKVGSEKDVFFRKPQVYFAHEDCLKKAAAPGFIWP